MKKVIIGVVIVILSFFLTACNSKKISFSVNEVSSNTIVSSNSEDIYDLLMDNQSLTIYKNIDQLEGDFAEKELFFNNQDVKNKYNHDFFENKVLIIFYNIDSRGGFKYKFKSLVIKDDELVLSISINKNNEGTTVSNPRLFFIEVDQKLIKDYGKITYKIS